ncbi:triacylglycerol lipase [Clostridium botulinum]|uniref:lipase family alpha/beta hydrolase n=1 Tax=Clostridium sp. M14 TaxID=2716311 RepID=UPI0013EE427F|nr:triacylglycerol lipase [Clostridium sp. M14]MBZ9691549.1 triacylglycerol lipase [Clostridium sp. M14]NFG40801.1 triacylglycerol lipase [Clostridium botulinum]NFO88295.1 triacylglycerol lipase [Clostridium botulinum]NFP29293.1 triacylglycerol lipase [Clostridium botulinum]
MIGSMITFITTIILISIMYIDINKKMFLLSRNFIAIYLIFAPHIVLMWYFFCTQTKVGQIDGIYKWLVLIEALIIIFYIWMKLNIVVNIKKKAVNTRLKIMIDGRSLIRYGLYIIIIQSILYITIYKTIYINFIPNNIFIMDIIITVICVISLITNGILRILCTSKRLNIIKRIIIAFWIWIPVVNIFILLYICNIAKNEYDHECYKVFRNDMRVDSDICKTKYPIVLVHGVGFRDLKYINYWGRIPKELIRNGATVYYGNQEAWGTIIYNAQDIKNKILQIIRETGVEKVNIIAHSKGGLDARYMVSKLNMGEYVASLTMISSPHRGCKFVDIACKMPNRIYKFIAKLFDKYYRILGDKNPDFYTASRQFSTYHSKEFNQEVKDADKVYYQSYASVVSNIFSDYVVAIPYILVKLTEGENDGLVAVDSAKWGEFKGILKNKYRRGISHGDIIDLRRDDYKGFDVIEKYIEIVSDLKNKGF